MGRSHGDVSRFHIGLDAAHTILPQACLRTLLRLDEHASNSDANGSPLVKYAAEQYFSFVEPEFGSPLYYASFCGFYDLAEPRAERRLIMKHPEQVNGGGGRIVAPLAAALYKRDTSVSRIYSTSTVRSWMFEVIWRTFYYTWGRWMDTLISYSG